MAVTETLVSRDQHVHIANRAPGEVEDGNNGGRGSGTTWGVTTTCNCGVVRTHNLYLRHRTAFITLGTMPPLDQINMLAKP